MTNKKIIIVALSLFLVSLVSNANAGAPKGDVPNSTGKGIETISITVEKWSEKLNNFEKKVNEFLIGPGISQWKSFKENFKELKDQFEDVKDKVDEYKEVAEGYIEQGKDYIEQGKDYVEMGKDYAEEYAGVNVDTYAQMAKELAVLESDKKKLEAEYKVKIEAETAYYDGTIEAINTNISSITTTLNGSDANEDAKISLNNTLDSLKFDLEERQADKTGTINELNEEKTLALKDINAKISELKSKMQNELKATGSSLINKYWSKMDTKSALEDVRNKVMLGKDDPMTSPNIQKVTQSRRSMALDAALEATELGIKIKSGIDNRIQHLQDLADSSEALEGENAAIILDAEIKIEELKILLDYNKLLIADMKLKSSSSLSRSSDYTVSDDTDIGSFNLDNYNFEQNCKNKL